MSTMETHHGEPGLETTAPHRDELLQFSISLKMSLCYYAKWSSSDYNSGYKRSKKRLHFTEPLPETEMMSSYIREEYDIDKLTF